jgi:hypothetical protein
VATTDVTLRFVPTYGGKPIVLEEQYYKLPSGDSVMFETFKAYISAVVLFRDNKMVTAENNDAHLLNASDVGTMSFSVHVSNSEAFNSIHFNLGVDSVTSTSGALGGDLDPAKGMFWTWQSGYINCKIEGRSNLCKTRHNEFQLHLGGYAQPDNSLQSIVVKIGKPVAESEDIIVEIPLDKFLSQVDLRKENAIMSPGKDAVVLARKLASVFEVKK